MNKVIAKQLPNYYFYIVLAVVLFLNMTEKQRLDILSESLNDFI